MKKKILLLTCCTVLVSLFFTTFVLANTSSISDPFSIERDISNQKHFSLTQIDALVDKGYTYDEIRNLTLSQVDQILTKDLNPQERERYNLAKQGTTL